MTNNDAERDISFKSVLNGLFRQYGVGFDQSYEEAQECFQSAKDNGLALFCASKLASWAEFPERSPDYVEAFKYLRESAILGFGQAQFELARAYELGCGTATDIEEAKNFYGIATQMGIKGAVDGFKRCEAKLKPAFQLTQFRAFVHTSALWTIRCTTQPAGYCILREESSQSLFA